MAELDTQGKLQQIRRRVPWTTIKPTLQRLGLPLGHGWDGTIQNIIELFRQEPSKEPQCMSAIVSHYKEHLYCGEKTVRFYVLSPLDCTTIFDALKKLSIPESLFSDNYPFAAPNDQIEDLVDTIELVNTEVNSSAIKMLFCSVRNYEEVVTLDIKDLHDNVVSEYGLSDQAEITIKRNRVRQFFDAAVVNLANNTIELRIDWGAGMNQKDASKAIAALRRKVRDLIGDITVLSPEMNMPIDLFPLIPSIYKNNKIGRVCELGFTVNSGSVKQEKMRRHTTDIRTEEFHKAGHDAVEGQVSPYRLAVSWDEQSGEPSITKPELDLKGTLAHLSNPNKGLWDANILNCYSEKEFNFIVDVMFKSLSRNEEQSVD